MACSDCCVRAQGPRTCRCSPCSVRTAVAWRGALCLHSVVVSFGGHFARLASTPQTCTLDVQRHQCMCGAEHVPYHSVAPSFCAQVVACRGRRPPNLHLQHGGAGSSRLQLVGERCRLLVLPWLASPSPARCTMQVWPIQIPLWLYTFEGQKWGLMYCGIGAAVRRKSPVWAFILFVLQRSLKNRRDRWVAHTVYIYCVTRPSS